MGRPRSATVESAAAEARASGYEPLEDYPGTVDKPWKVRCGLCEGTRMIRLSSIRKGRLCGHRPRGGGGRTKVSTTTPSQAEAELRKAGYEPAAPYPGAINRQWQARCTTCGNDRHPRLADVRRGLRCAHTKNYDNHVT